MQSMEETPYIEIPEDLVWGVILPQMGDTECMRLSQVCMQNGDIAFMCKFIFPAISISSWKTDVWHTKDGAELLGSMIRTMTTDFIKKWFKFLRVEHVSAYSSEVQDIMINALISRKDGEMTRVILNAPYLSTREYYIKTASRIMDLAIRRGCLQTCEHVWSSFHDFNVNHLFLAIEQGNPVIFDFILQAFVVDDEVKNLRLDLLHLVDHTEYADTYLSALQDTVTNINYQMSMNVKTKRWVRKQYQRIQKLIRTPYVASHLEYFPNNNMHAFE